ncbi:MAG TPA: glycoside hydrolase, partial [Anaerolineae bacterium]
ARANLQSAAESGLKHGALGYLNTDWGDNGHWQYLPFSYPGFAYGAALAWAVKANRALDIARAVSLHAFRDPTERLGQVVFDLGQVDQELGMRLHNSTALFRILQFPLADIREKLDGLTPEALKRAQSTTDRALLPLRQVRSTRPETRLVAAEFKSAAALLGHAVQRGLLAWEDDPAQARALKRKLKRDLPRLIQEYRRLWHARNRPGGFRESVARLKRMRQDYATRRSGSSAPRA